MMNKDLIKFRFKKSIETYENFAVIQKEMAELLVEKILQNCEKSFPRIFEFGVGTGFLSRNILNKIEFENYCANDIIEESEFCIKNIINNAEFIAGDIEKLEIRDNYDLVISNAVMQWIVELDELLAKINKNLNNNGIFAFTTFGEQNFKEIRETTGVSLNYLKAETLKEKCKNDFEIIHFEENIQTLCFKTPIDVLKHIKYSGTNGIKSINWTSEKLKKFESYYKQEFGINNQVTLTYNPIYIILKKKSG